MSAELAQGLHHEGAATRSRSASLRTRLVLALGPATVLAGIGWSLVQPWRLTILHPYHQGFWWLVSEPPLYVVVVGIVFRLVVAPALAADLDRRS